MCSLAFGVGRGSVPSMHDLLILVIHLVVTVAKLLRPGGARSVVAESLALKHQLIISNRGRKRAPIPRKGFYDLLGGPPGRRILRHIEIHELPAMMCKNDQHKQHFEVHRGHGKEVDQHEFRGVVFQKCPPSRRRWLAGTHTIFLHRRFCDLDAELSQLAHDARRTPAWVGARYFPNQFAEFFANRGPAGRTALGNTCGTQQGLCSLFGRCRILPSDQQAIGQNIGLPISTFAVVAAIAFEHVFHQKWNDVSQANCGFFGIGKSSYSLTLND